MPMESVMDADGMEHAVRIEPVPFWPILFLNDRGYVNGGRELILNDKGYVPYDGHRKQGV